MNCLLIKNEKRSVRFFPKVWEDGFLHHFHNDNLIEGNESFFAFVISEIYELSEKKITLQFEIYSS
jgi:hypothetical protein